MSAGKEFQTDGAATEKTSRASSVPGRPTCPWDGQQWSVRWAQSPNRYVGLYQYIASVRVFHLTVIATI